jgi:hypothetical protein
MLAHRLQDVALDLLVQREARKLSMLSTSTASLPLRSNMVVPANSSTVI